MGYQPIDAPAPSSGLCPLPPPGIRTSLSPLASIRLWFIFAAFRDFDGILSAWIFYWHGLATPGMAVRYAMISGFFVFPF
jgi:hypothetical protein